MKRKYWILIILSVLVAVIYLIPNPTRSFSDLYEGDNSIEQSLLEFRKIKTKKATIDGYEWEYVRVGKGEETIVFLHGMGGAYDIWWQQINRLKSEYTVISVTYPAVESVGEMADAIIEILDIEEINKSHVIGSSLGGYLAQNIVARYPNRVVRAIFGNTFPPNDTIKEQNKSLGKVIPFLPEWLLMKTFRGNIEKTVVPTSESSPLVRAYLLEQDYGIMSKEQFIARFRCVIDRFEPADSDQSTIPILILDSDNDPLIYPELREEMLRVYPSAKHYRFKGSGHFTYLNRPERYTERIVDFLKSDT